MTKLSQLLHFCYSYNYTEYLFYDVDPRSWGYRVVLDNETQLLVSLSGRVLITVLYCILFSWTVCGCVPTLCSRTTCRRSSFLAGKPNFSQKGQKMASSSGCRSSRWFTYFETPLRLRSQRLHGQPMRSLQTWLESAAAFSGDIVVVVVVEVVVLADVDSTEGSSFTCNNP